MATKPKTATTFMDALTKRVMEDHEREPTPLDNVFIRADGSQISIAVDTRGDFGPSTSGKTTVVANTGGFITVGDVMVSLNVNRKVPKR